MAKKPKPENKRTLLRGQTTQATVSQPNGVIMGKSQPNEMINLYLSCLEGHSRRTREEMSQNHQTGARWPGADDKTAKSDCE